MGFKSDLGRFCRTYSYIAQLIDFGDPELENFAAFAKLLQKRLQHEAPETVDLTGLVLTGFDINARPDDVEDEGKTPVLQPAGAGGGGAAGDKPNSSKRLSRGSIACLVRRRRSRIRWLSLIRFQRRTGESDVVMAQVESNTREQAMKGNLPGAVQQAVVRALSSHQKLATQVLKSDRQGMTALVDMVYDLLREGKDIDLGMD
jgi:type I restriction enzyme R subunit